MEPETVAFRRFRHWARWNLTPYFLKVSQVVFSLPFAVSDKHFARIFSPFPSVLCLHILRQKVFLMEAAVIIEIGTLLIMKLFGLKKI